MEFIDTHTHNYDEAFSGEEDAIIAKSVEAGITTMLQADIDSRERGRMFSLVDRHPGILRPMVGLYPGSVGADWKEEIDRMLPFLDRKDVVAVGEIGLDYHYGDEFRKEQKEAFRVQLEIAAARGLPVNIHLRDATEDFFAVLSDCAHLGIRGNLHAFSGSIETFRRISRYGDWLVGIGGVLTFRKASIAETVKDIPMDRIILETDSPYLAPTPLRGTRNDSSNIPLIALRLAELKGLRVEEVAEMTTANAKSMFAL